MSDINDGECLNPGCACKGPGWIVNCIYATDPSKNTQVVLPDATALANFLFTAAFAAERMGLRYEVKMEISHSPRPGPADCNTKIPDFLPPEI